MNEPSSTLDGAETSDRPIAPSAPLILDFDETYWLRNSTETFLDSARPAWIAAWLLKGLDLLRPWRLLPGPEPEHVWRDWLRVLVVATILPWSLWRWKRQARLLGPKWLNPELALEAERVPAGHRWIVTNGFRPIVAPLVAALPAAQRPELLASPLLTGFAWRRRGKRRIVEERLGADVLARAVVVTDNDEDGDLLAAAGRPVHRKWPEARYEAAHRDAYVPFRYIERIKRPGERYFARVVLKDELVLLLLLYLWTSFSLPAFLAILALHASFWVIYEIVYVENDRVAERHETEPVLSAAYHGLPHRFSEPMAWAYGLALGLFGVGLMQLVPGQGSWQLRPADLAWDFMLWALWLVGLRGTTWLYNHVDKATRVPLYLPLQAFKLLGLALFLPLPLGPAVVLLAAHLAALWLPYIAYRRPGTGIEAWRAPNQLFRLEFALLFAVILGVSQLAAGGSPPAVLDTSSLWQLATGLAFFAFKARHDLRHIWSHASWLKRQGPPR